MKKINLFLFCIGCSLRLFSQTVDGLPAAIPPIPNVFSTPPWEVPQITEINRDPSRATAYSFATELDALNGDRTKSRMLLLNGDWDFARTEIKKTHERESIIADVRAKETAEVEKESKEKEKR